MLHIALTFILIISSLAIIALVLLQRGKGAEAGAGFGAGASGTMFGARGAGTALSRATAIFTAVFMLTALALAYVDEHAKAPKTIFDTAGQLAPQRTNSAAGLPPSAPSAPGAAAASGGAPASGGTAASGAAGSGASASGAPSGAAPTSQGASHAGGEQPAGAPAQGAPGSIPRPAPQTGK